MVTQVGICGAVGKMGQSILKVCNNDSDIKITAAIEHSQSPAIGMDAGEHAGLGKIGVQITDNISDIVDQIDVLIDFTIASALTTNLDHCCRAGKSVVIGTTGFNDQQKQLINAAAQDIAIVLSPNMSIGVNLCLKLLKTATQALGKSADIEIIEAHHKHKKDAPSGTALRMGEVIAGVLGRDLKDCAVYAREGNASERQKNTIGFSSIRAGDIVGEHTVMFVSSGECLEITHKATSRENFAAGAIMAAQWLKNKDKGLFNMQDVLDDLVM